MRAVLGLDPIEATVRLRRARQGGPLPALQVEGVAVTDRRCTDGKRVPMPVIRRAADGYRHRPLVLREHDRVRVLGHATEIRLTRGAAELSFRMEPPDDSQHGGAYADAYHEVRRGLVRHWSVDGPCRVSRSGVVAEWDWVETSLVTRPADDHAVATAREADPAERLTRSLDRLRALVVPSLTLPKE